MKVTTKKGFTLAELLIVMAIMVVLAAIAIPTFGKQLETARETADQETLRAALTDAFSQAFVDYANAKAWKHANAVYAAAVPESSEGANDGVSAVDSFGGVTLATGQGAYMVDIADVQQSQADFNYISPTFKVGAGNVVSLAGTAKIAATSNPADAIVFVFAPNSNPGQEAEIQLVSATLVNKATDVTT